MTDQPAPDPHVLFRAVGEALFGEQWIGPVSAALDIDRRRVERMANDKASIPRGVWLDLAEALEDRRADLDKAAGALAVFLAATDPE